MSLIRFYTYRDKLLVPTVVRAEEGFYLDAEPVTVCDTAKDAKVRAEIERALAQDNEPVPTPPTSDEPGSVILDELGIKKWLTFEKDATMYTVQMSDDKIHYYSTGRAVNGTWRADEVRHMTFERKDGLNPLLNSIMNDIHNDSEQWIADSKPKSGALMLLPAPAESKAASDEQAEST